MRDNILWWSKVAHLMVVVWFENGLPGAQQLQVLCHNIEIIAIRVQGSDTQFLALQAIIAMIVVRAENRYIFNTQNLRDASTQRRLTRSTIPDNAQNDWALNSYKCCSHNVFQTPYYVRLWLVTRCQYHLP